MDTAAVHDSKNSTLVPVLGLSFFAVASGFLMSLIPLSLTSFGLDKTLVPWLASIFYLGLLIGATSVERVISKIGHRAAFVAFLCLLIASIIIMLLLAIESVWLGARFIAGMAVAGVFVVVESWLLMANNAKARAKRLGLYMTSLYGGSALGQLAIGPLGTDGVTPYLYIIGLLMLAVLPPLLIKSGQPEKKAQQKMRINEIKKLSRPAIIGCLISGLLLGPIYGLMPSYITAQDAQVQHTGILMACIVLGGMLVQPLVSYLSTRMSKSLLMAMFSLLGTLAVVGILESQPLLLIGVSYLVLGAASFALYPIAITLACETLPMAKIVSATEIMLLSYSVGSVLGPLFATKLTQSSNGILYYLGGIMLTSCLYMLIKSIEKLESGHKPVAGL
ncbi:arabinose efflux permease family protein [Shewanella psychrophila]|uniref:Arabinose efflux permease family protein n=1 Tax=Shewanella psychrophila TaxID=225848 RepID=A0A1S6HXJ1_9GAMM|nr:MFS transporter [Shewanella psychrophila]AQS40297.1 arabinose efflux permease family protein [Shewanella psychrophila]